MTTALTIAMQAVPFFDLLDQEQEELLAHVLASTDEYSSTSVMESSRRRLSVAVDTFVRSLPTVVRNDAATARAAAYALVGLADERIIHHPAGGLGKWADKLLEFDLYGSALAGQEIVKRARQAASGTSQTETGESSMLTPLYLAVFRAGFEGSLRGDAIGLNALVASLEESVGMTRGRTTEILSEQSPARVGIAPLPFAILGIVAFLLSGFAVEGILMSEPLKKADRLSERVKRGLPVGDVVDDRSRSVGPSGLPPLSGQGGKAEEFYKKNRLSFKGNVKDNYAGINNPDTGGTSWKNFPASEVDNNTSSFFSSDQTTSTSPKFGQSIAISSLPSDLFVVQLKATESEIEMNNFLAREGIQGLPVVRLEYQGGVYFVLLGGFHQTRKEAEQESIKAIDEFPGAFSPWINKLRDIQQAMSRAQQSSYRKTK